MKTAVTFSPYRLYLITLFIFLLNQVSSGQTCADPVNIIYGISNAGDIYPITVSTGVVGARLNPPYAGNPANSPNGIGYNPLNGKFYYFKRHPVAIPQEFVSYDPATGTVAILNSCPTANAVYVGCVTADGTGYYCWDSQANLYYYKIALGTWTFITNNIKDQFGNDIAAFIRANGSGDLSADGLGNLMMLPSSATLYALYKLTPPLPVMPVASITVFQVVAPSAPPAKFVGIAFNSTGQILINTTIGDNRIFRLEKNLSLTYISTMTLDMADLTSCNFPLGVLPVSLYNFNTTSKKNAVTLIWNVANTNSSMNFLVEQSTNGSDWSEIGDIKNELNNNQMSFTISNPVNGQNFYRIKYYSDYGTVKYSPVKNIYYTGNYSISIWPNPAKEVLQIERIASSDILSRFQIVDQSGRILKEDKFNTGIKSIDVKNLSPGIYYLLIQSQDNLRSQFRFVKQ